MSHALVIGGSLAGLLSARVLSDHYDRVTVIERDHYPDQPEFRNGVPQSRHLHILLAKGHEVLAQFFPTLEEDFQRMGIPNIDLGWQTVSYTAGGWTKRVRTGIISNPVTRVTLDWYVRQQLLQRSNISFLTGLEVQSLTANASGTVITGVEAKNRDDQSVQTIDADLIVDASGRTSKAPEWLKALGYIAPPRKVVNSYLGYATRWYEIPTDRVYDRHIILITPLPNEGNYRAGAIQEVENNQWVVTLAGMNKVYPPTDEEGFLEFARQLPSPAIYEAIKEAKPVSPVYGYRRTENVWNHFEQLPRHPDHFIVIGDAYCGFNPVYGQGMSVAAMEAQALDKLLREKGPENLEPAEFYGVLANVVENVWLMATGEDLRYPGTEGDRPGLLARLVQKYVERIIAVLPLDEEIGTAFLKVNNLLEPPQSLLHPRLVARVLRLSLRGIKRDDTLNAPVPQMKEAISGD